MKDEYKFTLFKTFGDAIVYEMWPNDSKNYFNGSFSEVFKEQASNQGILIPDNQKIIFNCCDEGIGPKEVAAVMENLNKNNINLDIRVLFNVKITKELPYKYRCFIENFTAHYWFVRHVQNLNIDWKHLEIDKQFIALMRRPTRERVTIAKLILDSFESDRYMLSCGGYPNKFLLEAPQFKEILSPYEFPILIDGIVDDKMQHYHTDERFFKCFINFVIETSSQVDPDCWDDIFITEKSLKSFAYRQIPIWFAVPETVSTIREMGFDVYDDIIDHSYDLEYDSDKRLKMAIDAINKFNNMSFSQLSVLRGSIWNRIEKNADRLFALSKEHPATKNMHLSELIK